MRAKTAARIALHRAQATQLQSHPHAKLCDCCTADLALVLEDPAGPCAATLLGQVRLRCAISSTDATMA